MATHVDLGVVFEEWLRSRVPGERPGRPPGSVTEGGYDLDVEGMRRWRSDCAEFLVWLQANEPEMFGEFRYRYQELDPGGWDALVGFAGGFHDMPAGPPDEPQLESDLESLVDFPVDVGVLADPVTTTTVPLPVTRDPMPVTTTTDPVTTTTDPVTTTTVPVTTTTVPVTPDSVPPSTTTIPPPTTTVPPSDGTRPVEWEGADWGRPSHEHEKIHTNIAQGFERLIGHPGAELQHTRSIWAGHSPHLMPTRKDWSRGGWDPVFNFVGSLVGGLFDLFGDEDEPEKESLTEVYGTDRPEMRFAQLEGGWNSP